MKVIEIPKLKDYQHYKPDQRPIIWIKIYKKILQDYKFQQLRDNERWLFVGLILLAVENDNKTPLDFHYIAKSILFSGIGLAKKIIKLKDLNMIAIKTISKRLPRRDKIRKEEIREEGDKNYLASKGLKVENHRWVP